MLERSNLVALLGAVSLCALCASAQAADMTIESPVRSGFDWSGAYIGASVGVAAFNVESLGGDGISGEITAGYDYMVSERFLLGAFANIRYGNPEFSMRVQAEGESAGFSIGEEFGFDAGLRAGYLLTPQTLGYVLGGYSRTTYEARFSIEDFGSSHDKEHADGFILGAGLETTLGGNWTLKNEYRYGSYSLGGALESDEDVARHSYNIGVNYRFGADSGAEATFAAPAYNWTGFYIGAQAGLAAYTDVFTLDGGGEMMKFDALSEDGAWASLNIGYDHEFGDRWVAGVQAGVRYSSRNDADFLEMIDSDYGFDILARLGAKVNESTLAYVIGGYTHQRFEFAVPGGPAWNADGFTIGSGIEVALRENVSLNLEYRFSQYEEKDFGEGGEEYLSIEPRTHTFGVGVKYKFN